MNAPVAGQRSDGSFRTPGAFAPVGLSEDEERCYITLVWLSSATAHRLSEEAAIPARRIPTVLQSLQRKGLVSRTASRPHRYVPAPPELAVENLIAAREREIAGARLAAARLQQRLRSTPDRGTAADMVEVILGREAVTQRFRALSTGAKEHVEILVKPPYVTPMAENREEEDRLAHGVRYRLIYEGPMLEDPRQLEVIRLLVGAGARVRILPSLPTKLAIFDGRFAFLAYAPHLADDPGVGALLVRPSPLLDALSTLFEILWDRAVPFGKAAELPTKRNLTPDDQTLLALLAAGLKDEAIARHLQLGHRTIQRRVARLMSILGVDTRFQAGMQARDRGWLALDPPGS